MIPLSRREALAGGALLGAAAICPSLRAADAPIPRVAVVTTCWYHNSHSDVIAGRLIQSHSLDGKGVFPKLKLASLYCDQHLQIPGKLDKSQDLSRQYGFPIYKTIAEALTLGGDKLAVDGVLVIAEHGDYPESATGQVQYPKRPLMEEVFKVFDRSGRAVPIFNDKHLSDTWTDAKWIVDEATKRKTPMLAGSSLPLLWRYPAADVKRGAKLKEIVAVSFHRLDTYGIHALEFMQALAERRAGDETGVASVKCVEGPAVWEAMQQGKFDRRLLDEALARLKDRPIPPGKKLEEVVRRPALFQIQYVDGLKASVVTLNDAVNEWTAAWRYGDDTTASTLFWTQEARPFQHFGYLLNGIEQLVHTGRPPWPIERTLLTTGMLDALLNSRLQGKRLATPQLAISYKSEWNWREPPAPPAGRPLHGP